MTQISVLLIVDNNNTQREQVKYSVYLKDITCVFKKSGACVF